MYNMIYVVTFIFILLDFFTGFVAAVKNKEVSSKVLREGLYHKGGFILLAVLATLIEHTQGFFFADIIPVVIPCCVYIVVTEITSILENICKLNPEILPEKLQEIFGQFTGDRKKDE